MDTVAQTPETIQAAIHECFARCFAGGVPIDAIGEYCGELRAGGWDETDIRHVDSTVRRMLLRVVNGEKSEDDVV